MKVRIIAGKLKNRILEVPSKFSARPMGSRVRSALFNSLLGRLEGARVLDAFGGSGACGVEAYSRGAKEVLILEKDRFVFKQLKKNLDNLNLEDSPIVASRAPIKAYLKADKELEFDIIICDPPYDVAERVVSDLDTGLINTLNIAARHLADDGLYILSWPSRSELPNIEGLVLTKSNDYAGASLGWYIKS